MPEFIEDNLRTIIIVVIVGGALIQKILEAVKTAKTAAPPVMAEPPPPARQRTVRAPQLPPPLTQHDEDELARQRKLEDRLRQIRAAGTAVATAPQASHAAPIAATHAPIAEHAPRSTSAATGVIRQRLRRSKELRRAFITKEILDRPLGLR